MTSEIVYYRVKGYNLWHTRYSDATRYVDKSKPFTIERKTMSEMSAEDIYNIANSNLQEK